MIDSSRENATCPPLTHRSTSWQQKQWSSRTRRRVRITAGVGLLLVLGAVIGYTLLAPFARPQVHVFVLSGETPLDVWPESLPSLRPTPSASTLLPLIRSWTETARLPPPQVLSGLASGQTLDDLVHMADTADIVTGDVEIGIVQSQLATIDGELYLIDRLNPRDPQRGWIAFDKFIEAFCASPAKTKLLCLDAGDLIADPRSGICVNDFGHRLQDLIEKNGDRGLWVLVSHRPGQHSQTAVGRVPTIFLDAVVRGFGRDANQDGDYQITLSEFVHFVDREVASLTQPQEAASRQQLTWLLRGGGASAEQEREIVLAPFMQKMAATSSALPVALPVPSETIPQDTANAAPVLRPVTSMTVPELLDEAWSLRDRVEQIDAESSLWLRPCDYAPWSWKRMLSELVHAELLWRCQSEAYPTSIHRLLQIRVNDLRALAGTHDDRRSEWLKAVRQLQPHLSGDLAPSLSLFMSERWCRWTRCPANDRDLAERVTLQTLLKASDAQPLLTWLESKPTTMHSELELAWRLSQSGRTWPDIQEALRVRCTADEFASHPVAVHWFTDDLARGDRLRWYGERKLCNPLGASDIVTAQQAIREAGIAYHQVAVATECVAAAQRLETDLLADLPFWMTLSRNPSLKIRSSLSQELATLMGDLEEIIERLANQQREDLGRIEQLRHTLERSQDRITSLLFPECLDDQLGLTESSLAEMRPLATALLETPLPSAPQRATLQKWLAGPQARSMDSSRESVRVDQHSVSSIEPDYELELQFSRLLQPLRKSSGRDDVEPGLWEFPPDNDPVPSDSVRVGTLNTTTAYCRAHVALPGELRKALGTLAPDPNAAVAWRHTFWLIDPRDQLPVNVEHNLAVLHRDRIRQVIRWQWQQAALAQSDAPSSERERLQQHLDCLGALLSHGFNESHPRASRDALRIISPDVVNLAVSPEQTLSLMVQNPQGAATRVRYIVEHDPDRLEVEPLIGDCQLLVKAPGSDRHILPYEASHLHESGRFLPADGQDELRLRLRGQRSEGPTQLIVHIVTDRSTVRKEIIVHLPQSPLATVVLQSSSNEHLIIDDHQLRPFANRLTSYSLQLQGLRPNCGALDITAYRVTTPTMSWPSATTLPTVEFQRWLSQQEALHEIATVQTTGVNPETPVPLCLPAVKPDPNVVRDAAGGFIIVMHDAVRQLSTWQHLPCMTLRPPAYVLANVAYDASRELLEISVRPNKGLELPPGGIPVRCRIIKKNGHEPSMPRQLESSPSPAVTGCLQPHQSEFTLSLAWRNTSDHAVVLIDVDDWPRAFVFDVEPAGVEPSRDLAVEILSPQRRSTVRAPAPTIPVSLAITIPTPLAADENLIEVGIDRNGDRRLDGEPTVRLHTDRQTSVTLESIDATGAWTLKTSVRDWQLSIPTAGLGDQWGTILTRIAHGPTEVWSEGTAVAFDKTGPQLTRIDLSGSGELVTGQPVKITTWGDDQALSGVASIVAGIDLTGLGVIGPNTVMVPAKNNDEDGWAVMLPTEKLTPGSYYVVLQATDYAGNTGPVSVVPIRCLTAEEAAIRAAVSVQGQVQYAGEAVSEAELKLTQLPLHKATPGADQPVSLTAKSNRKGQFVFNSVAPGEYELTAVGTIRGFRYESGTKVKVAPGNTTPPVQLVFGQKAR